MSIKSVLEVPEKHYLCNNNIMVSIASQQFKHNKTVYSHLVPHSKCSQRQTFVASASNQARACACDACVSRAGHLRGKARCKGNATITLL